VDTRKKKDRQVEDPRETVELFADALTTSGDDAVYWCCLRALRRRGGREVLELAASLAFSADTRERLTGVRVIARLELDDEDRPTAETVLHEVLALESDPLMLRALASALDSVGTEKSVPYLLALTRHSHPKVRLEAIYALSDDEQSDEVVERLIGLTQDPDDRVRDWATFALASSEADTPEIRRALVYRTRDADRDTREEAMRGLAERGDSRVVEPLLLSLAGEPGCLALGAATAIGDPRLFSALQRLAVRGGVDEDDLADALAACRPRKQ
jgi:HEAT repeat protein